MSISLILLQGAAALAMLPPLQVAAAGSPPRAVDIAALFEAAEREGRVGRARKSRLVDARPAVVGEIVVTVIRGEGEETRSAPAKAGDMVVRNRCPETGNEEILVAAASFASRYAGPLDEPAPAPWAAYRPRGIEMSYFILPASEGTITFVAPWGEPMIARPGDAIVRDPGNVRDTYRIAKAAFACTYEITQPARHGEP
jgi:hypothetical protein